jgi:23S rRNA (uracil1939-C5)-methyltransferase
MILKNIKIDKVIFKGFGLGTYQGKKIFLPFTYPGDVLDAKVLSEKKDYFKGLPVKFSHYGVERVESPCPVFKECGGCNSLDILYANQCAFKKQVIQDIFPSYTDIISDTIGSPSQFNYRNKVFFPVTSSNDKITFGMFKNLSHSVVSAKDCQLVSPFLLDIAQEVCNHLTNVKETAYNEKLKKGNIRHIGLRVNSQKQVILIIVTNKSKLAFTNTLVTSLTTKFPNIVSIIQNINKSNTNKILGDYEKILYGQDHFIDEIANKRYKIHYQSFFQVNRQLTEIIYQQIKDDISASSNVLDAYSGVSTIGLFLADKAASLISVESNKWASQDAQFNIKLNKARNIQAINDKLEDNFANIISNHKIDTIVFDPPRKGLESNIRSLIKESSIKKIIYLSCNPGTQKRDVDDFLLAGFKVKKIIPFDMFPNTYHIENYMLLER